MPMIRLSGKSTRSARPHQPDLVRRFGGSEVRPQDCTSGTLLLGLSQYDALDTTSLGNGQIFQTDATGDGTTGDPAPGTVAGSYMHQVKPTNLGAFITNYNNSVANTLTPAGKAVAASASSPRLADPNGSCDSAHRPGFPRPTASSIPPIAKSTRRSRIRSN